MYRKSILLLLLLSNSWALAQSAATSPSRAELLNQIEATTPVSRPNPTKEAKAPAETKAHETPLGTIANTGLDQSVAPATVLSNADLLARSKTIYVVSNSFFVKKEQLERGLINRKELADWGIHVVDSPKQADLVLTVKRAPFQNNFPFTLTDRVSGIVVMGGTVNSLFGTVPGKIAGRLADHLKEVYKAEERKQR